MTAPIAGDETTVFRAAIERGATVWHFSHRIVGRVRSGTVLYLTGDGAKFTLRKSGEWVLSGVRDNGRGPKLSFD